MQTVMNIIKLNILQYLFHNTTEHVFTTMYEFEVNFGLSGSELRSLLEDLKDDGFVVENDEGFKISRDGVHFAKSRWV